MKLHVDNGDNVSRRRKLPLTKGNFGVHVTHTQCDKVVSTLQSSKEVFKQWQFATDCGVIIIVHRELHNRISLSDGETKDFKEGFIRL